MKISGIAVPLVVGLILGISTLVAPAQPASAPAKGASTGVQKAPRAIPFHGTIASVDPAAKSFTVGKRTFQITVETKLYRNDKSIPGTMKDAAIGGAVSGSYVKSSDGKLLARSVYFKGPAPTARPPVFPGPAAAPAVPPQKTGK